MEIDKLYNQWICFDKNAKAELEGLSKEEIEDRFYRELEFGTGGIRGKIGYGTNRINYYTVARVTMGLCDYLIENFKDPFVVIAYDSRHYSKEFSEYVCYILSKFGVKVKLFKTPTPTPILSFTVRYLNASAGIVITASHNPKEYNGYKVYNSFGNQITNIEANKIQEKISRYNYWYDIYNIKEEIKNGLSYVEDKVLDAYMEKVYSLSLNKKVIKENSENISIVYTPLNGAGGEFVKESLNRFGFKNVYFVKSQFNPNGDFPETKYPNPEEVEVFEKAIKLGCEKNADILIATDPDCDRVGIMIKTQSGYRALNGNEIGTLLTYYTLSNLKEKGLLSKDHRIIKTIVTTNIVEEICKDFEIGIENVLTGFKYIGEKIEEYNSTGNRKFILGFEESYGYLIGDFVRDKDGIIASSIISEMVIFYKSKGLSLFNVLEKIYKKYGYYKEELLSFTFEGKKGSDNIKSIMESVSKWDFINKNGIKDFEIIDYNKGVNFLPLENVISIKTEKGNVTIRPSGTEPKIKFYIMAKGENEKEVLENITSFKDFINKIIKNADNK